MNPVSKWKAFKGASQQIKSELWKFRARVGDQSTEGQKLSNIAKILRHSLTEIVDNTISKDGISESTVNKTYSRFKITSFQ